METLFNGKAALVAGGSYGFAGLPVWPLPIRAK